MMAEGTSTTPLSAGRGINRRRAQPPSRLNYGALGNPNEVPSTSQGPPPEMMLRYAASKTSSKSSVSIKKKQVEIDAKKKLRDFRTRVIQKEDDLAKLKSNLENVEENIKELMAQEKTEENTKNLLLLQQHRNKLKHDIGVAAVELETAKKHLQMEEEIVNDEKDLELEKIDDESGDDDLSEGNDEQENDTRVEEWVDRAAHGNGTEFGHDLQQQGFPNVHNVPTEDHEHQPQSMQHVMQQQQPTWGPAVPIVNCQEYRPEVQEPTRKFTRAPFQPPTHFPQGPPCMQPPPQGVQGTTGQPPLHQYPYMPPPRPPLAYQQAPAQPFAQQQQPRYHASPVHMQQQQPPPPQQQQPPPIQQHNSSGDNVSMRELVNALQCVAAPRPPAYVDRDLPVFGGKPEDWLGFKSHFERTTLEYRLTNSDNLQRLRRALKGGAMEAVKFLFNTPDNVPEIMNALEFEFGRVELIIKSLIVNAESVPKPDINKPESVIVFARAVQSLVSTIRNHGQHGYMDGHYLLDKLVDRLPIMMQRNWSMFHMQQYREKNLQTFLDFVLFEKAMATVNTSPAALQTKTSDDKSEQRRRRGPGVVNTTSSNEKLCLWCDEAGHQTQKCKKGEAMSIDDRWKCAKEKRVCVSCLNNGHKSRDCKKKKICGIDGCQFHHHSLLHSSKKSRHPPQSNGSNAERRAPPDESGQVLQPGPDGSQNFIKGCDGPLPILSIKARGDLGVIKTHALLDGGASCSLISKKLANELGLGLTEKTFSYTYYGAGGKVTDPAARRVTCDVAGVFRGSEYKSVRGLVAVDELPVREYSVDMEKIKRKWPHLQQVHAKTLEKVIPDLIIGNNNPHIILPHKLVCGKDDEPWGWRTPVGWTVSGNFYGEEGSINTVFGNVYPSNEYLHQLIKTSFSVDDLGVKITTAKGMNLEERRAREILERTTKKVDNRWEVGLLWRDDNVSFPDTMASSLDRLERNERRMKRDPLFAAAYNAQVKDFVDKGYAKKLTPEEAGVWTSSTYIVPTFGVLNPNKPGKFRLVMDAKSKSHGVSLNDKLLKGPDLIRPLTAVLWNWRKYPIALTGDIREMFLRVGMRPEDRDSQRFLWRNGDSSRAPDHYRMEVLIFGATSSPASAIFVKDRNADMFQERYPQAAHVIKAEFYLDDCLSGGYSEEEVIQLRQQINEICSAGNFEVIKWLSNSTTVLKSIPEEMRAAGVKDLSDKEEIEGDRVLGLWWDPNTDTFQFRLGLHKVKQSVLNGEVPTKREMCGLIMSLFDPIGFIAHFKIKGLILLQQVWNAGVGWDDQIPMDIFSRWKAWLSRLPELSDVKVPRHYFCGKLGDDNVQLHVFVDASSEAYSAVCYFRAEQPDGIIVSFVAGKSRVAPLKKNTIPRLELLAALVGARMAVAIGEELRVKKNVFWTDSTTVLQWLRSPAAKLKEFVANRIGEIQEVTNISDWRWVPTKLNVADLATRWESDCCFLPDSTWFTGPTFLKDPEETWQFEELRRKKNDLPEGSVYTVSAVKSTVTSYSVPEPTRFSSFLRLQRSTAGLFRIMRYLKNPEVGKPWYRKQDGSLGSRMEPDDMDKAELLLCKQAQSEAFPGDIQLLKDGKPVGNKGQLWRLSPRLDEKHGVIVMAGRISKVTGVPEEMKTPIILPSHHPITDLLIDMEHSRNAHQGAKTIQANLQRKFWIVAAGHAVNRSFARCWKCKMRRAKPVNPQMAVLPVCRLAHHQPAFTNVGIDLFGPVFVTVGRHHEKRWGVVICCMTTRAVYLDVVHDLTTDELIMAISRFVDTRIRPSLILCDNGTNLVGAARKTKEAWREIDLEKMQSYGLFSMINWSFNTPGAPHMGGAWESMVKLSKKCLESVLLEKAPKDTTLLTALKGAESILNSRPLTAISSDPADPLPLTPNHFIRGICDIGTAIPSGDEGCAVLREKWRRSQQLQQVFWDRWTREFLPKLLKREKWHAPVKPMELGDIVVVMEDNAPVKCWKRGYISKLFPSGDGQVRSVEISSRDFTTKKTTVTRRPVVKVMPLGLSREIKVPEDLNLGASVCICSGNAPQMSHLAPGEHATQLREKCISEEGKE